MADEGTVNSQILDSVAHETATVLGSAPAGSTGMLDTVMAETIGMAMYNAVTSQHNAQMVASAAVAATCARMLRIPGALPMPFKLVNPIVIAANPATISIPVQPQTPPIQIIGTNFQQNLSVDVFDPQGNKAGTLSGEQITNVTVASFNITTNLFTQEGSYGIEVVNPDGGRSSRYAIKAEAQDPQITGVAAAPAGSPPNSWVVTGKFFQTTPGPQGQPSVTLKVQNSSGQPAPATIATTPAMTTTSFTMTLSAGTPGPYSVQVVNQLDGATSNSSLFVVPSGTGT